MSVQKLVAEADKLFEKGKVPDGIAKLKAALSEEPLNQIVATKLAGVLVQNRDPLEAAKVYGGLAKRLSDAGKSSVAIAIYKQALELAPDDIALRSRYAAECEAVGKLGDAFLQGQIVLNYYLRRKKYFDASNVLPLMARSQPKDDKIKMAWLEVMLLCQAEQKLVSLLVALAGPPGVASPDFPVGGDPVTMSPAIYENLKKLVPFFPRDPKVAYAVAWSAYRRGRKGEFYHYLRECLRREPDFCLAVLLFARVLAEDKRLNEALFLYRYYRERMASDKNADMLTLNRLMEAFVEKNGWIKFIEDSGDLLDAAGFLTAMTGQLPPQTKEEKAEEDRVEKEKTLTGVLELPPAEIDIGGMAAGANETMEIVTATGQSIQEAGKTKKPVGPRLTDPMRMQAELIKATIEATVAGMGGASSQQTTLVQPVILPAIQAAALQGVADATTQGTMVQPVTKEAIEDTPAASAKPAEAPEPKIEKEDPTGEVDGFKGESVEFTSLIKFDANDATAMRSAPQPPAEGATQVAVTPLAPENTTVDAFSGNTQVQQLGGVDLPANPGATPAAAPASAPEGEEETDTQEDTAVAPKKKLFNPLEQAMLPGDDSPSLRLEDREERTQMFSPMDVLDAAKVMQNREFNKVDTKKIKVTPEAPAEPETPLALDEAPEADKTKWRSLQVTGERTIPYSPVEAVRAATDSRRPHESTVPPPPPPKTVPAPVEAPAPVETPAAEAAAEGPDFTSGDATVILKRPVAHEELSSTIDSPAPAALPKVEPPPAFTDTVSLAHHTKTTPTEALDPNTPEAEGGIPIGGNQAPNHAPQTATASEGPAFMPIPASAEGNLPGAGEEKIDMGTDLLDGPTKIFTQPIGGDKTEHLLKEIKHDLKNQVSARLNIDMLMKKAERFIAKRNYYLARKALRHAQALGADEEIVKGRLREIRKLELPEGLYNTISSDQMRGKVDTSEVLERLELEFDLTSFNAGAEGTEEMSALVETRIEEIFRDNDPRTILDFGVGLHEMGLLRQAEALFMRLVEEFPDHAFDAYYLAAVSKLSRRDYAGAASILKRLSTDVTKTDLEKIQIYYALGEIFEKMRQPDRSKKFFRKVAELDANYRNIRHKLDE
ncbi:MAG: hypothetical protein ACXVCI_17415 [Bdellovibrionota bacterium]